MVVLGVLQVTKCKVLMSAQLKYHIFGQVHKCSVLSWEVQYNKLLACHSIVCHRKP